MRKKDTYTEELNREHDHQMEILEQISQMQRKLRELNSKISTSEEERDQLLQEQAEKFQQKTRLDLLINDMRNEMDGEKNSRVNNKTTFFSL